VNISIKMICTIISVLILHFNIANANDGNLISNGDFEVGNKQKATSWSSNSWGGATAKHGRVLNVPGALGKYCYEFKRTNKKGGLQIFSPIVDVNRKALLQLSFKYKGEAYFKLSFYKKENGKYVSLKNPVSNKSFHITHTLKSNEWKQFEFKTKIPAKYEGNEFGVRIYFLLFGNHPNLNIDNIKIIQANIPVKSKKSASVVKKKVHVAKTLEDEEAARIQIQTGTPSSTDSETFWIFPTKNNFQLKISTWYGAKVKNIKDENVNTLCIYPIKNCKPWAGVKLTIPKNITPLKLENAETIFNFKVSFKLKIIGNASLQNMQISIVGTGSDGKSTQSRPLWLRGKYPEWREVSIRLKDFRGLNKLKSLSGFSFQFIKNPPSNCSFLISSLCFKPSSNVDTKFFIDEVNLNSLSASTEIFPRSATNIRIKGPNIVRDNKPVFITGVEDDVNNFPWLYKLMEFDIIQLQDLSINQQIKYKIKGDNVKVSWPLLNNWFETKIRYLLHNGFAIHANYWDFLPNDKVFKKHFSGAIADTSHFYSMRLDNPIGRKIKENHIKGTLRTLGKYPITFYEFYNELYYGDISPTALVAFQKEAKLKYGSIALANKMWDTNFISFNTIIPPRKKTSWMSCKTTIEPQPVPIELYVEWQRFNERWLGKELKKLTTNIKKHFKFSNSYVIYQAVMALKQGFNGCINTYPKELLNAEDALCHEGGMNFYTQKIGAENNLTITKMTKSLMIWDLLKGISPDKPLYLSESGINTYGPECNKKSFVINFDGSFRFMDDSHNKGNALGFYKAEFDDSKWSTIKMPGVWGKQGYPKCTRGWFRRTFSINPKPNEKIFLTGKELADIACLYLNGKLLHQTSTWSEAFSIDISDLLKPGKNTLAISIDNKFKIDGQVQGGIRNFLALTNQKFFQITKTTAGQIRSWFWSMAVHGVSGVSMSYFYTPATNKDLKPIYSPIKKEYEAVRALPAVKREINAVSEILLPRPRLKGTVAFVYPFETGRAYLDETSSDLYSGFLINNMMSYYLSALFSQITPEVTTCDAIKEGAIDKFKAIVMPVSTRVLTTVPDRLKDFVASGGVLILGPSSMSFDDDTHKAIPSPSWLGIKVGSSLTGGLSVTSKKIKFNNIPVEKRRFDSSYGVKLQLNGAEKLAVFDDGSPAITVNKYGKGWVYYFACNLPFLPLKKSISSILTKHGIQQQTEIVSLDGVPADYIESHIIGSKDNFVWYLNNFGGGNRKLKISWPNAPAGVFKLTNIKTGEILNKTLNKQMLKDGIVITAPSQDPVTLLIERKGSGKKAIRLNLLPTANKRFLNIWRQSPKGEVKVLFNTCARDQMDPFRMLTGKKLLEDNGFEISYAMDFPKDGYIKSYLKEVEKKPLSEFNIYTLLGTRWINTKQAKEISNYVKNGGSMLLSAAAHVGYFGWQSNHTRKKIFKAFNMKCSYINFKDEQKNVFSPSFCTFSNISKGHPVTVGVEKIQLMEASVIDITNKDQNILIKSNATSIPSEKPFLVAMKFGKGRVVVMGDAMWLQPEWLDKADNAQLMLNIFNWLAHKKTKIIPREILNSTVSSKLGVN